MLTGKTPAHPARWSREILERIAPTLAEIGRPVHDPFAGTGERLGKLCDSLGLAFTGTDIEAWPNTDPRVLVGEDSLDPTTYPTGRYLIVTSPVYFGNRISSDYVGGPLPTTKLAGRHSYGISLGRALEQRNLARLCLRTRRKEYDQAHTDIAKLWGDLAAVNVDGKARDQWRRILEGAGYEIADVLEVTTKRLGGGLAGADKRAPHEVVLLAVRP